MDPLSIGQLCLLVFGIILGIRIKTAEEKEEGPLLLQSPLGMGRQDVEDNLV